MTRNICTDYLASVYYTDRFIKLVNESAIKIRALQKQYKFTAIAFKGSSGAALAYPLSFKLKLPLIHVRKDMGHCSYNIEGAVRAKKYIIIDDIISTGETVNSIIRKIKGVNNNSKLTCIFLYNIDRYYFSNYRSYPVFGLKDVKICKKTSPRKTIKARK